MNPIEISVPIDRPLEEVFQYVSDPRNLPEWGEGIVGCDVITEGPIDVGSVFIIKNKMGGRVRSFENKVVAIEPNARFGFETGDGAMGYTSERAFETRDGGTIITERITLRLSGLMQLAAPLLMRLVRKSHYNSLLNMKAILES